MCLLKKPKVATPVAPTSSDKPLPILTNSRLDGRNGLAITRRGFQGLTIRRRGPTSPTTPTIPTNPVVPTTPTGPVIGGGGGTGSGGGTGNGGNTLTDRQFETLAALSRMPGGLGSAARAINSKLKV